MKVLVFTTLFPNNVKPNHGIFIKERMFNFANLDKCEIRVIAPVPYFPPIKINKSWYKFSQVRREERLDGIKIYHPRYFNNTKIRYVPYMAYFCFFQLYPRLRKYSERF